MASLQRTLVNLEMLSDDINALHVDALNTHAHIKLLHNVLNELENAEQFVALETEASFQKSLSGSLFENIFERKRMVGVYIKLVGLFVFFMKSAIFWMKPRGPHLAKNWAR